MPGKEDPTVTSVLAQLGGELAVLSAHEPQEMKRVAALLGDAEVRKTITTLLLEIMPEEVDGDQWIAWIQGKSPPLPSPLRDPDAGGRPHARGRMQTAQGKRDVAARAVQRLEAQLDAARKDLAIAEAELRRANDQVRLVVVHRLLVEIGKQASALALGPLYAIARAISPYLQRDPEFEDSLDPESRRRVDERRKSREEDSREILDRLDRYAGDQTLELNLHQAVLKVVRNIHERREKENAEAKAAGKPLPHKNKPRTIRRTIAEQQRSVHQAAPRADVHDVFDAFRNDNEPAAEMDGGWAEGEKA